MHYIEETRRQRLEKRRIQLESARSSFIPHWRDLGDYILPRRPRFSLNDVNKGDKKNQKIIDATATFAARTARSGMMSGVTSPARRWFRLAVSDRDLMEDMDVKAWLHVVSERMNNAFSKSNLYETLPVVYGDLITFGTSTFIVLEDFDSVIHTQHFPIGSYCISTNNKGRVDTFQRTYQMTVRQIVQEFGKTEKSGEYDFSNISEQVKRAWFEGHTEDYYNISHFIMPNDEFDPNKPESKFKKYVSVYYELGNGPGGMGSTFNKFDDEKFLRIMGFDKFRVLSPRWEINSEDAYATDCPGMQCLGDVKQLQLGERRAMQAIDKMVNPPMVGPAHLRNSSVSVRPGDITFVDVRDAANTFRPVHEVQPQLHEFDERQQMCRQRIRHCMFEDLFMQLSMSDRREMTAREVEERHQEKMWQLAAVLERLNQDMLNPLIDITFDDMLNQGLIPPAPEALQGRELKVEYVSVMAEAQKGINLAAIDRFAQSAANIAAIKPEALDKIDQDQLIDVYGDLNGIPPGIVKSDDQVAAEREERAKQMAQQQQLNTAGQMASIAKDAAGAAQQGGLTDGAAIEQALGGG